MSSVFIYGWELSVKDFLQHFVKKSGLVKPDEMDDGEFYDFSWTDQSLKELNIYMADRFMGTEPEWDDASWWELDLKHINAYIGKPVKPGRSPKCNTFTVAELVQITKMKLPVLPKTVTKVCGKPKFMAITPVCQLNQVDEEENEETEGRAKRQKTEDDSGSEDQEEEESDEE